MVCEANGFRGEPSVTKPTDNSPHRFISLPWTVDERRGALVAAALLVLTGLLFAWQAALLDFGRLGLPGPGFFPFVLGLALAGLAVAVVAGRVRQHGHHSVVEIGHRDVLIAFAALLSVAIAFELLGAYLTLGIFCVVLLALIAKVRLVYAGPAAAAGMALVWYFFKVLLGLQLPNGPF
jgi:hypothetical protein